MKADNPELTFSGERFNVVYSLNDYSEDDARYIADFACVEQTIEYPHELIPPGDFHDLMVGHIESFKADGEQRHLVEISYPLEATGMELPQLLNVVYGNISFLPGIRVERMDLPETLTAAFRGPRFGRDGIRDLLKIYNRPFTFTALKPMGLSADQIAEMAYQCALGGIDIIKDDHGLSDQPYCPFEERVVKCIDAVKRANRETGYNSVYFPNIHGPMEVFHRKVAFARDAGADGLMIMPGFSGFDTLRMVAEDDAIALPIIFHPGLLGTYRTSTKAGFSPFVLHGQISRLMGADITIFPHFGGRFAPPVEECRRAVNGTGVDMNAIKPNLPSPGGGVKPEHFKEMRDFYGVDAVFLVAGNLHKHGDNLVESSRYFRKSVESLSNGQG